MNLTELIRNLENQIEKVDSRISHLDSKFESMRAELVTVQIQSAVSATKIYMLIGVISFFGSIVGSLVVFGITGYFSGNGGNNGTSQKTATIGISDSSLAYNSDPLSKLLGTGKHIKTGRSWSGKSEY